MWKIDIIKEKLPHEKNPTTWQITTVKPGKNKGRTGALACRTLCEKPLRRPHLTCLTCRLRRTYYNKMPKMIQVEEYNTWTRVNRKHRKIKHAILKIMRSIEETFLLN